MKPLLVLAAVVGIACAASPAVAQPPGPTPAQIAAASPAERLNLLAGAGRFAALSGDMTVFNRLSTAPSDPGAPFRGLSVADQRLMAFVIGQSLQFTTVNGSRGVTAWFNPLEDVWVVGLWTPFGDAWRMTDLAVLSGDELAPTAQPWVRGGPTLASALRAQADRGRAVFRDVIASGRADAMITDQAHTQATLARVLPQARFQVDRLAATARLEGYTAYPQSLENSFIASTAQIQGDPAIREAILNLPTQTRMTLQPAMSFSRQGGQTFAVMSPYAPSLVFIVHFAQSAPGAVARPVRIEAVDLFSGAA